MRGLSTLGTERVGAGPRLVLVHGFTQTGRSWAPVVERLGARYEIVTVDAPGHGASAAVTADLATSGDLLVRAGGRATYIGYSMGGRIALHAALAHGDAVDRLVLLGATAGIEDPHGRAARRAADEALAADLERDGLDAFLARWLDNPLFTGLPHDAAGLDDRRRNTVAGLAASLRTAGTGTQRDLWPRLRELRMPVLVMAGEQDPKFRAVAERMAAAIGENATIALVPGAGHAAHLERPDAFTALLQDWLEVTRPGPTRD